MVFSCPKCVSSHCVLYRKSATMVGLYCANCGAWVKWVSKTELSRLKVAGVSFVSELPAKKIVQSQNLGFGDVSQSQVDSVSVPESAPASGSTPVPDVASTAPAPVSTTVQTPVSVQSQPVHTSTPTRVSSGGGCPFCRGLDSVVLPQFTGFDAGVEVYLLGDVLTVADKESHGISGLVRLRFCPMCGEGLR